MYRILVVLLASLCLPSIGMAQVHCTTKNQCIEMRNWDLGIAVGWGQKADYKAATTQSSEPELVFNSLESRNFTMLGGAEAFFYSQLGTIRLAYTHDMFNVHNGSEAQIKWTYGWHQNHWIIDLSLVFDWKSQNVVDYYYGVRPSENENPYWSQQYHADSAWNQGTEVTACYILTDNWELLAAVHYTIIADEIAASPLLDEDYSSTYLVDSAYRF